jgi:hypothetical protein
MSYSSEDLNVQQQQLLADPPDGVPPRQNVSVDSPSSVFEVPSDRAVSDGADEIPLTAGAVSATGASTSTPSLSQACLSSFFKPLDPNDKAQQEAIAKRKAAERKRFEAQQEKARAAERKRAASAIVNVREKEKLRKRVQRESLKAAAQLPADSEDDQAPGIVQIAVHALQTSES